MDIKLILCRKSAVSAKKLECLFYLWLKSKGIYESFFVNIGAQREEAKLANKFTTVEKLFSKDNKNAFTVYADIINSCLVWAETVEGHAFWQEKNREWWAHCNHLWYMLKGVKKEEPVPLHIEFRPRARRAAVHRPEERPEEIFL